MKIIHNLTSGGGALILALRLSLGLGTGFLRQQQQHIRRQKRLQHPLKKNINKKTMAINEKSKKLTP